MSSKRIFFLSALTLPLLLGSADSSSRIDNGQDELTHRQILDSIRMVESGGRDDCPDGDSGRSIGPFQIWSSYWKDAVSFDRSIGGKYQDCRNRTYSEKVVRAYMNRYVPRAWKTLDAEVIARTHNGGPRGARNDSTLKYWKKVRRVLAKQTHDERE